MRGRSLLELSWRRPALRGIPGDRNVYREANLVLDDRVVTLVARSTESDRMAGEVLSSLVDSIEEIGPETPVRLDEFGLDAPRPAPGPLAPPSVAGEILHRGRSLELRIPPGRLLWGMYTPWVPFGKQGLEPQQEVERRLGHKFELLMEYQRCDARAADVEQALALSPRLDGAHDLRSELCATLDRHTEEAASLRELLAANDISREATHLVEDDRQADQVV